jgi:hypothetical protein
MAHVLPSIENKAMSSHTDARPHQFAWLRRAPPRRVLGALLAYVSAVSGGIAAAAAVATAGCPVQVWIAPL